QEAERLVRDTVAKENPRLVVLPECYDFLGGTLDEAFAEAEAFPKGAAYKLMQNLSRELGVYIHAGSVMERAGTEHFNTTVVFNPNGEEVARYRKIHLFDIETPDGIIYKESDLFGAGSDIVTYKVDDTIVGCSICYDIRFGELYRKLVDAGAEVIVIPAAFTLQTGKDHWEILCRARAIETQTYVLAAGTYGPHTEDGEERFTYGNSMVVGPWGAVLARAEDRVGHISATIDTSYVQTVRQQIPVQQHRIL
ncbi:MAG: carbon-nitrogen hydrolase family protein, partial [Kordiimonadaceae bacterium]|nr:carbon-nitrogen hydrolase family protein [Kordiimonadaceae bacterium]